MPHPFLLRRFIWIVFVSALIGALYGDLRYGLPGACAIVSGSMGAALFSLDRFVLRRNAGGLFPRLPFLPYLALRTCLYAAVVIFIINGIANSVLSGRFMVISGVDLLVSLVLVVAATLLLGVNDLLGPGTLLAFAAGRYYHPRIEERALLFMDMRASTAIAERVGELRILDLLNRFIADVSLAVAEAGGEIHKYVGDEVIATWQLAPGANQVDCVRACFGAFDRIDAQRSAYERDFGLVPDFRAGLHCGPVAVGELGYLKKEIALIGDTMNAAARIVEACRETENRVLASAALLDRLAALPPGVTRRRLGELALRGKERPLELCALEADGDRARNRLAHRKLGVFPSPSPGDRL
jgi:adenylate cyclase